MSRGLALAVLTLAGIATGGAALFAIVGRAQPALLAALLAAAATLTVLRHLVNQGGSR